MGEFPPVDQQMERIREGAVEILPEDELVRKLARSLETGKPLVVKEGFDPTRPDLHLGHAVSLKKLKVFQDLGHEVVFVVGDFTALVGDPSGQTETRPMLTEAEVRENMRSYEEQVFKILDRERTRVERNSQWLADLKLADVLTLTSRYTVARMLERDDFSQRYDRGEAISMVEFLYPLMQGYDSIALEADVELGGTDQKFNLLVGRTLQERYDQEPQVVLTLPLLRGTDGSRKMSKSYGNYVGITDAPEDMYGKTMSIPDDLLDEWYRLVSSRTGSDLERAFDAVESDPLAAKRALARDIVRQYHGDRAAGAAEEEFDRVFRRGELPGEVPEVELNGGGESEIWLPRAMVDAGLASSTSEAVRLIKQGAVLVDGERVSDHSFTLSVPAEYLVQRGKRRFAKIRMT